MRTQHIAVFVLSALTACADASPIQTRTGPAWAILSQNPVTDAAKSRTELIALGDAAVQPIAIVIRDERDADAIRIAFLVGILEAINTEGARDTIVTLLVDVRPRVRGYGAEATGRLRIDCAVPRLISLLSDKTRYSSKVSTDPFRESPVTVSDSALKALVSIAGKPPDSRELLQANYFEAWWREQAVRVKCQ